MIHWTSMPHEQIFSSTTAESDLQEIMIEGVQMQVRLDENRSARIVRLLSLDPDHYLDPRFQPGNVVELPKISN